MKLTKHLSMWVVMGLSPVACKKVVQNHNAPLETNSGLKPTGSAATMGTIPGGEHADFWRLVTIAKTAPGKIKEEMENLWKGDRQGILDFATFLFANGLADSAHEPYDSFVNQLLKNHTFGVVSHNNALELAAEILSALPNPEKGRMFCNTVSNGLYGLSRTESEPGGHDKVALLLDDAVSLRFPKEIKGLFIANIAIAYSSSYGGAEVQEKIGGQLNDLLDYVSMEALTSLWVQSMPEETSIIVNKLPPGPCKEAGVRQLAEYSLAIGEITDAETWCRQITSVEIRSRVASLILEHKSGNKNHATLLEWDKKQANSSQR